MIYDVIIIGFGISGIAATKNAVESFKNVLTLEKESQHGGNWFNKSYPNVRLQTHKNSYMYSDMYMESKTNFPTNDEILTYLNKYIIKHNLNNYVKYDSDVNNIYYSDGIWNIVYSHDNTTTVLLSNNLLICSGIYNIQKQPEIKNLSKYKNIYLDSNKFSPKYDTSFNLFTDKNVFIIGNGPTGCDFACNAVKNNAKTVTIIYRSNRWIFKRKTQSIIFANRLLFKILQLIPKGISIITVYILFFISYYMNGYWKDIDLPNEIINRNNIVFNDEFYEMYNNDQIKYIQSHNLETSRNSIIINGIYRKKCDIIINACGYDTKIPIGENTNMNSIPLLYKRILHPSYNSLGFIGFSTSYNWLVTSEIQSLWLLNYFKNKEYKTKNEKMKRIKKDYYIAKSGNYEYIDLAIFIYDYLDDLLNDCGKFNNKNFYNHWLKIPKYKNWIN